MNEEETYIEVARQAFREGSKRVVLGDESFRVTTTAKLKLRQVNFEMEGREIRGIEQNPLRKSRWAALARQGKKVMQFTERGRYVAVVVDEKYFPYG